MGHIDKKQNKTCCSPPLSDSLTLVRTWTLAHRAVSLALRRLFVACFSPAGFWQRRDLRVSSTCFFELLFRVFKKKRKKDQEENPQFSIIPLAVYISRERNPSALTLLERKPVRLLVHLIPDAREHCRLPSTGKLEFLDLRLAACSPSMGRVN